MSCPTTHIAMRAAKIRFNTFVPSNTDFLGCDANFSLACMRLMIKIPTALTPTRQMRVIKNECMIVSFVFHSPNAT